MLLVALYSVTLDIHCLSVST